MNVIHRLKKNLSSAVLSRVCQSADSAVIPAEDFMSLRPIVNSPLGQFAFESIRPLLDNSPFGQFALLSIRPQTDNSPFSQSALSAIRLYIKQNKNSYWRKKINIKKWEKWEKWEENNAKINLLDISAWDFVFLDKNKENTKTKCINVGTK